MTEKTTKLRNVRVISDNGPHPINSVVALPEGEAAAAVAAGWADDTPEAVKYAESLGNEAANSTTDAESQG